MTGVQTCALPISAWWDSSSSGPFDHLGLVSSAFELEPGGSYIGEIVFTSKNGWEAKTARTAPATGAPQMTLSEEQPGS